MLVAACGGAAPATSAPAGAAAPSAAPTRDPARDGLPLAATVHAAASAHTFQGGDDHLAIGVDNHGRDIQDLVLDSAPWVAEHTLAMGSTRGCDPDLAAGTVHCGPVFAGQSFGAVLRATPAHVGTFHYEVRLLAAEGGRLSPITGADGSPLVVAFDEVVDPVVAQVPGWRPDPTPTP